MMGRLAAKAQTHKRALQQHISQPDCSQVGMGTLFRTILNVATAGLRRRAPSEPSPLPNAQSALNKVGTWNRQARASGSRELSVTAFWGRALWGAAATAPYDQCQLEAYFGLGSCPSGSVPGRGRPKPGLRLRGRIGVRLRGPKALRKKLRGLV